MAIIGMAGFETDTLTLESLNGGVNALTLTGTAAFSTTQARTGSWSIRLNPTSGNTGYISNFSSAVAFVHFGLYIASLPTVARAIFATPAIANGTYIRLNTDGTLSLVTNTTLVGTSATALSLNTWYWIGYHMTASTTGVLLQIDGTDQVSGTNGSVTDTRLGLNGTEASAIDLYVDDVLFDDATFRAPSKVALLVPISDNAVGTGWTLGTGTAISGNSGSTAVKNTPPLGVADLQAGSDVKQIRNATSNATVNYDANLTTYSTAGIGASDTVLAVQQIVATAAPVTTSAKQGTVGMSSNPTIANIALAAGGTAGAFWSGTAAGTYATGWKASFGTLTLAPSVTLGSSPVARITQVTSSTRIAMVCFMAMYVAWTPAAVVTQVPYQNPYPQLLPQ